MQDSIIIFALFFCKDNKVFSKEIVYTIQKKKRKNTFERTRYIHNYKIAKRVYE